MEGKFQGDVRENTYKEKIVMPKQNYRKVCGCLVINDSDRPSAETNDSIHSVPFCWYRCANRSALRIRRKPHVVLGATQRSRGRR